MAQVVVKRLKTDRHPAIKKDAGKKIRTGSSGIDVINNESSIGKNANFSYSFCALRGENRRYHRNQYHN